MKGMVFTEFLEMVEETFSLQVVDQIIEASALPSGGSYTAVGSYDHREIVQLVLNLSKTTAIPVPDLLHSFGKRLFARFSVRYAHLLEYTPSAFAFLEKLESYVHAEVKKLYPDAELPTFECMHLPAGGMHLIYRSHRSMADLAHGLIEGCFHHFGEKVQIQREDHSAGQGALVHFILTPVP